MSDVLETPAPADGPGRAGDGPGGGPGPSPDRPGASMTPGAAVLAGLVVDDLDLDEARHLVKVRSARRLRRRRLAVGCTATLTVLALVFVLWPQPDPQEINADGDREVTTTITTLPATTPTTVATTVVVTTVAPTVTTAPVVTTVPPTTLPPNQAMTVSATLRGANGVATAGDAVVLDVAWTDPDLAPDARVEVFADFGDPLVTVPISSSPSAPCEAPGPGTTGGRQVPFRYASTGRLTIQVEVVACGGTGAFGELRKIQVPVDVQAPPAGQRIAVVGGGDGRDPDVAEVLAGADVIAPRPVTDLVQVLPDGTTRATVARIPDGFSGELYLRWGAPPDASCQVTVATPPPSVTAGTAPVTALLRPGPEACPDQTGAGTTSVPSTRP